MGKNQRLRRVAGSRLFRNLLLLAAALTSSPLGYPQGGATCALAGEGYFNPPGGCGWQCATYNCTCSPNGTGSFTVCISCYGQQSSYATGCISF